MQVPGAVFLSQNSLASSHPMPQYALQVPSGVLSSQNSLSGHEPPHFGLQSPASTVLSQYSEFVQPALHLTVHVPGTAVLSQYSFAESQPFAQYFVHVPGAFALSQYSSPVQPAAQKSLQAPPATEPSQNLPAGQPCGHIVIVVVACTTETLVLAVVVAVTVKVDGVVAPDWMHAQTFFCTEYCLSLRRAKLIRSDTWRFSFLDPAPVTVAVATIVVEVATGVITTVEAVTVLTSNG